MKKILLFFVACLCLSACEQPEDKDLEPVKGEFIMTVDYDKSITQLIYNGSFSYACEDIIKHSAVYENKNKNHGKKTLTAAIITFNKIMTNDEIEAMLKKDGRYRSADIYELLALNLQFPRPYFYFDIGAPKETNIGNGLYTIDYTTRGASNSNPYIYALGAIINKSDYVELPLMFVRLEEYRSSRKLWTSEIPVNPKFNEASIFLVIKK